MKIDFSKLSAQQASAVIAFVVDNNPRIVAAMLAEKGYNLNGLSYPDYKGLIQCALDNGQDISWLGDIAYVATTDNWTSHAVGQGPSAPSDTAKGVTWADMGQVILMALPAILAAVGTLGNGTTTPVIPPKNQTPPQQSIMGLPMPLFYGLALSVAIVVVLIIIMILRKK